MESEDHLISSTVPRQDSGVPDDANSPMNDSKNEEDADSELIKPNRLDYSSKFLCFGHFIDRKKYQSIYL